MKAMVGLTILATCGMMHAQVGHATRLQAAAIASKAPAGTSVLNSADADSPREAATGNFDSDRSTARFYIGSAATPEVFDVAVARVSGAITFDRAEPARSEVHLIVYPSEAGGPAGPNGRLTNGRPAGSAAETELLFRSSRTVVSNQGELQMLGELTVRQIRRDPTVAWSEAYAGPTYGEPAVSTMIGPATLVVAAPDTQAHRKFSVTASLQVGEDHFPGLTSTIVNSDWPVVVENEECANPENFVDYDGPVCTGTAVSAEPRVIVPTEISEDYYGMSQISPHGGRVTVTFNLAATPPRVSSQSGGD